MQYLYHHLPSDLKGTTLYPLNELKSKFPDIYENELSKYAGRENITQQHIPLFDNCLWNDVIFMTALNPQELFNERRRAGWGSTAPQLYLKIDPRTLDPTKLGVFLFKLKEGSVNSPLETNDFTAYNYDELKTHAIIPQATKDYFKYEFDKGERRIKLFYRYIPHILYKGTIDISNSEIITVH
jgi:hypothetical protein